MWLTFSVEQATRTLTMANSPTLLLLDVGKKFCYCASCFCNVAATYFLSFYMYCVFF